LVISEYNKFENLNFFLTRVGDYNPNGRMQTLEEAIEKDKEIKYFMLNHNIDFVEVPSTKESISFIINEIKNKL